MDSPPTLSPPNPRRRLAKSVRPAILVARAGGYDTVVPAPDYRLGASVLALGGTLAAAHAAVPASLLTVLGGFLCLQTSRVRFVFGPDALEVVLDIKKEGGALPSASDADQPENAFVGGENRWRYDSFVNWEFWWPDFPVLVYFKETQTSPEGQVHFFPCLFDGASVLRLMRERAGPSATTPMSDD